MALRGNLRDFTITQLLNLVNLAQKTGTLVVDGPSEQAYISFCEGKLAYARVGQEDGSLATVLHKANKLTVNQYRAIVERTGRITDKELGLLLINAGYLSQEEILLNLQSYFTEIIRRLFTWVEGFSVLKGICFHRTTALTCGWTWRILLSKAPASYVSGSSCRMKFPVSRWLSSSPTGR